MKVAEWIAANWSIVLNAVIALLGAVILIASLIPGDEPETTLTKLVDFLSKFSKK